MKTVGWSVLFLASFLVGHFSANPWLLPVGNILLFVKLYVAMLLVYILLTQIIPYLWQHISEWGSNFQRTAALDNERFGGGMQLSFASTGMMTAPEKHEQDVVPNNEVPVLTIVNASTMTESRPVELKPETKPVSEAEFLAAIRGLTLLPPAVALPEKVLDATENSLTEPEPEMAAIPIMASETPAVVIEPTETELAKANDEEFLAAIRGLVLLLDARFLMESRKLTLIPTGELDIDKAISVSAENMTTELSVLDSEPEPEFSQSELTVVDEVEVVALVDETVVETPTENSLNEPLNETFALVEIEPLPEVEASIIESDELQILVTEETRSENETEVSAGHLHIASEDLSWILAEDSTGIEIEFEASAEVAMATVVDLAMDSDLDEMESVALEGSDI